jgi:hypothetical protein
MNYSDTDSQQLSGSERLAVTWALIWPYVPIDALLHESHHIAALLGISVNGITLAAMILDLFVVWPWAVRRAFRLRYSGFQLGIVRPAGEAGDRMNYGASLSVAWLLLWRLAAIIVVVGAPFAVAWKLSGGSLDRPSHVSLSTDLLVRLAQTPIEGGLFFWLLGGALRKQYHRFWIRIHRTDILIPRFSPLYEG